MRVGEIILYPTSTVPKDFLVCDGSAISRLDYSDLFNVIGTTYGAGDGVSTFCLPNLMGRVPIGSSSSYVLGSSDGEEQHVLGSSEMSSHSHAVPQHGHTNTITATTPKLTHTITQPVATYTKLNATGSRYGASYPVNVYTNTTSAAMTRSTNLSVAAHTAADCTMSGGIIDAPAFDTESSGDGTPHDNMMPYLTLVYLIYSPEPVYPPGMVYFNGAMVTGPSGCYFTGKG